MADRPTWDDTFLALAKEAAKRSRDPSTKIGAVIVGPDKEVRSLGYNGFPRGVRDDIEERFVRPLKYKLTEHSERNAIYNAARVGIPLKGCTVYVPWIPCSDCARAIIQVGIVQVVTDNIEIPERWKEDFTVSLQMLEEAKVEIRLSNESKPLSPLGILKGSGLFRAGQNVVWEFQNNCMSGFVNCDYCDGTYQVSTRDGKMIFRLKHDEIKLE